MHACFHINNVESTFLNLQENRSSYIMVLKLMSQKEYKNNPVILASSWKP